MQNFKGRNAESKQRIAKFLIGRVFFFAYGMAEFGRIHAGKFSERDGKILSVVEAYFESDVDDVEVIICEQFFCLPDAQFVEKRNDGFSGLLFEQPLQICFINADFIGQEIDGDTL